MDKKVDRLELNGLIDELNVKDTLDRISINKQDTICDYGAGSGLFTRAAAKITENLVYALDQDENMIDAIRTKAIDLNMKNILAQKVQTAEIALETGSIDIFILSSVLHKIENIESFILEIKRVLKPKGKVLVVEFIKADTPKGPEVRRRLSSYQGARHFLREDIILDEQWILGENMYAMILQKEK